MRGNSLKTQTQTGNGASGSQRQATANMMAVSSFSSKAQAQVNINRPQTTGKVRVNYTGKLQRLCDSASISDFLIFKGATPNEYQDQQPGLSFHHRGSRKNIQIGGKTTERAVSLVTQHRLNQTQGPGGSGGQFAQTGFVRHKLQSGKANKSNLSGI